MESTMCSKGIMALPEQPTGAASATLQPLDIGHSQFSPRQAKLGERLKKLKVLVMDVYQPVGANALAEFAEWFAKADQARLLRTTTRMAHGVFPASTG